MTWTTMRITPELLREWDACWDHDRITDAMGGRPFLTPAEIAARDDVSAVDRMWVLFRVEIVSSEIQRAVYLDVAAETLGHADKLPDSPSSRALRGVTDIAKAFMDEVAAGESGAASEAFWCRNQGVSSLRDANRVAWEHIGVVPSYAVQLQRMLLDVARDVIELATHATSCLRHGLADYWDDGWSVVQEAAQAERLAAVPLCAPYLGLEGLPPACYLAEAAVWERSLDKLVALASKEPSP